MRPSPALDDHLADQPEPIPTADPIPGHLIAAVTVSTVAVLLVFASVAVPAAAVPEPVRDLAIAVMVGAWAIWYMHHLALQLHAAIRARLHGTCCAEAYVAGLTRQPFPGTSAGPHGRHLYPAS